MNYEIEKNIPLPDKKPAAPPYPVDKMEVGDSIVVEMRDVQKVGYHGKKIGRKFRYCRLSTEEADKRNLRFAYRVWRVE